MSTRGNSIETDRKAQARIAAATDSMSMTWESLDNEDADRARGRAMYSAVACGYKTNKAMSSVDFPVGALRVSLQRQP
jgi:hypothetical protein